ncbi:magnesium chelatase domain-containing protein [Streptomyces sp. NPDC000987]|uniref:magnesium chelatase domain-containing protein n=1 Tax=Streptomyces sp. NPDC000987 TaxID=3154374 RepID=UPI00333257F2
MTETIVTDPAAAAHSQALEDAYQAAHAARRALYAQTTAYAAHLIRKHLPDAAALTVNTKAKEVHEVLDANGNTLWHAPSAAGHGLPDTIAEEVDGILSDVIPFGSMAGAGRWTPAPQGLPFRTVRLPEPTSNDKDAGERPATGEANTSQAGGAGNVRATLTPGLGAFRISGLKSHWETRDRVRAAVTNSGYAWPLGNVTVHVTPRPGATEPSHDLAIACTALAASGAIAPAVLDGVALIGELGLDGRDRPVPEVTAHIQAAQAAGYRKFIVAADDFDEASRNIAVTTVGVNTLRAALDFLEEMAAA